MDKQQRILTFIFGIPWIIFGIQHYLYADFVATLVPAFVPVKLFWVYLTGTAMIAAGISFIAGPLASLAAKLLALMLSIFIVLIHIPGLTAKYDSPAAWSRPLQDAALACTCVLIAGLSSRTQDGSFFSQITRAAGYLFAALIIAIGIQQFFDLDFVTGRIPAYFPLRIYWVYLTGVLMIAAGICAVINRKGKSALYLLGFYLLLICLLNHGCLLAGNIYQPILWTGAMIELAVTTGILILAKSLPKD